MFCAVRYTRYASGIIATESTARTVIIVCVIVCLTSVQALEMVRFLRWAGSYGHRTGELLAVRSCCIMQCDRKLSVTGTSSYYITSLVSGNRQCVRFWFRRVTPSDTWIYCLTLDPQDTYVCINTCQYYFYYLCSCFWGG